MQIPPTVRVALIALAALSVVWFPWPLTATLIFAAGLAFPPAALALGVAADLLYYPGWGVPWATLTGMGCALAATLVRHILKTRIM